MSTSIFFLLFLCSISFLLGNKQIRPNASQISHNSFEIILVHVSICDGTLGLYEAHLNHLFIILCYNSTTTTHTNRHTRIGMSHIVLCTSAAAASAAFIESMLSADVYNENITRTSKIIFFVCV